MINNRCSSVLELPRIFRWTNKRKSLQSIEIMMNTDINKIGVVPTDDIDDFLARVEDVSINL